MCGPGVRNEDDHAESKKVFFCLLLIVTPFCHVFTLRLSTTTATPLHCLTGTLGRVGEL